MTDTPEDLAAALSLAEQVALMSGEDFWSLPALPDHGIGKLRVTDGPNGARGSGSLVGGVRSAAFPVGICLGASWNPDLVAEIGAALADEVRDKGAHVLLAPTINLQRGPLNGRNFECYSEDPWLTSRLAVAYVQGLQSQGIAATPKHFVGNESEIRRTVASSNVDERTLRELYLVPFEAAVREGGAWAIMTSYNKLNGTYTAETGWLLTDVLRDEWGFDGVVMSDWYGSRTTAPTVEAGLDLEMPGPSRDRGETLVAAVESGEVEASKVAAAATNVLRLAQRTGALRETRPFEEKAVERDATRALIRRAGAEGMVLLKNDGVLPLAGVSPVAMVGPNAETARAMGGGSAQLNAHRLVSPAEGMRAALSGNAIIAAKGVDNHRFEPSLTGEFEADWFDNADLSGEPVHRGTIEETNQFVMPEMTGGAVTGAPFSVRVRGTYTAERGGTHRIGFHVAGRGRVLLAGETAIDLWEDADWSRGRTFFEEGSDPVTVERELAAGETVEWTVEFRSAQTHDLGVWGWYLGIGRPADAQSLEEALTAAAEAEVAVVCVGRSAEWDTEGWDLPGMRLPGDQDELVRRVAKVAKRTIVLLQTGGPVEMPWAGEVDAILQAWYPGQEAGHAIADVLTGAVEPTGRLPQSFPARLEDSPTMTGGERTYPGTDLQVHYDEGLHIGYRHHARAGIPALFPFGHGLGYGRVEYGAPELADAGFEGEGKVRVRVPLSNPSDRDTTEVVQLYVAPEGAPVDRPAMELKAFAKLRVPAGGEALAELELGPRAFAYYDVDRGDWVVAPGRYTLRIGRSAEGIEHELGVTRAGELRLPR
ncbi:beta-glucosidase [Wenxinia saemankumensis]|uniref:Beta-glucosidase n=1 Tax=Wenxinia saemankumensis TaxID=1447782 RepID=A0A1M6A3K5_9RHOB|nr:glycoside hydrolase family 3 C-terminal domain-containing protein [Wenxinia saemankumensis]SHI31030.1 beta-glucosidase [Wenxinia saemankumensis]